MPGARLAFVDHLLSWMASEQERVKPGETGQSYLRDLIYAQALTGDESFGEQAVARVCWGLIHNQLDELDRAVAATVLTRVLTSQAALKVASGVEKRKGQARRGWLGFSLSVQVAKSICSGSTAEVAWATVGEANNLSPSAVKQHWTKWKPELLAVARDFLGRSETHLTQQELTSRAKVFLLGPNAVSPKELAALERAAKRKG